MKKNVERNEDGWPIEMINDRHGYGMIMAEIEKAERRMRGLERYDDDNWKGETFSPDEERCECVEGDDK